VVRTHGAHGVQANYDGSISVVRPGKDPGAGASASIIVGDEGDAVLTVFSPHWGVIGPRDGAGSASWILVGDELRHAHRGDDPIIAAIAVEEQIPDEAPPEDSSPADYFGPHGLMALTLTRAVQAMGAMETGIDGRLWRYYRGVYLPDGEAVARQRVGQLLANRYRSSHRAVVVEMLGMGAPRDASDMPARWVNCANGLLDWMTGELDAHTPDVFATSQLPVDWTPSARCPTVDAWLAEVVEADVIELVWEIIGMALYAGEPFHRAIMLSGPGRNGKGTLLRLIEALVGAAHCAGVTLQQLAEDRFASAQLFGKTVNLAGDLDARAISSTGVFKMVTGGDSITAQRKYGQLFDFTNRALMIFAANEIPVANDHTLGYESRWVVVPMQRVTLAPGTEDKTLEARMRAELGGVLVRAVAGLRSAMVRGDFMRPASVVAATDAFRRSSNPIHAFADECLEVTGMPTDDVARAAVYAAYQAWCLRNGHRPLASRRFWPDLSAADPRIDTGTTPTNEHGYRVGQTKVVQGVRSVISTGFGL
jgi:putative DNA primase/helicase